MSKYEVEPKMLRNVCDPDSLGFETTEEIEPIDEIIGQERAIKSMEFGLRLRSKSYNIFVAGITGTGKTSYVTSVIEKLAATEKAADDWCYVYNFKDVDCPVCINLPAGMGEILVSDMEQLVETFRRDIPAIFQAEEFRKESNLLVNEFHGKAKKHLLEFEKKAKDKGMLLRKSEQDLEIIPLLGDKPLDEIPAEEISEEVAGQMEEKAQDFQQEMDNVMRKVKALDRELDEALEKMEQDMVKEAIKPELEMLQQKYRQFEKLLAYFSQVEGDILENLEFFKKTSKKKGDDQGQGKGAIATESRIVQNFFNRYSVNLFVNNKGSQGAPVKIETNPNYYHLFGKIEGRPQLNTIVSDFSTIKSGAIHSANGGYLIIQAAEILKDPIAWDGLKRSIQNREAVIENIGEQFKAVPSTTVKPEPIPLEVKVILIGSPHVHQLLYSHDEDFHKLFKIKVQFDTIMNREKENIKMYAQFISSVCDREGFMPFHKTAIAKIIETGSYLADEQQKLSTRFNRVVEIIYEAAAWAEIEGAELVKAEHVDKALEEKINRANLMEEKIHHKMLEDVILIESAGGAIGQVNGLTVLQMGDYQFGQPARITARTFLGENGIINIEREVEMSGAIHNKGVLILEGYLGGQYAKEKPLSLTASICFEQNYGGIDGDSASCAELVALLSSIVNLPVKQSLAITGSMNQLGAVQPIGGVNQKIEGFYRLCKARGLTGEQGVIIPVQNQKNLMLPEDIVEAIMEKKFTVYAISTIDQAIELMLGLEASKVHQKVNQKLASMADLMKRES